MKKDEAAEVVGFNGLLCCAECTNCKQTGVTWEQPYPEYLCAAGKWDSVENPEELSKPVDCEQFTKAT